MVNLLVYYMVDYVHDTVKSAMHYIDDMQQPDVMSQEKVDRLWRRQ